MRDNQSINRSLLTLLDGVTGLSEYTHWTEVWTIPTALWHGTLREIQLLGRPSVSNALRLVALIMSCVMLYDLTASDPTSTCPIFATHD